MTVRLELTPEMEAGLLEQAQASGLSLEAYAVRVLRERIEAAALPQGEATAKARAFEQWARSHPSRPALPPESFRRGGLVRDAG